MSDVATRQRISCKNDCDIVILKMGSAEARLYYHNAFEIVSNLRVACKLAMRADGVDVPDWRMITDEYTDEIGDDNPIDVPTHPYYRRSEMRSNISKWAIEWLGGNVILVFDDSVEIIIGWRDGFMVQKWLRNAAKGAKAWAGDRSRHWNTCAYLNDAEENYKHGWS